MRYATSAIKGQTAISIVSGERRDPNASISGANVVTSAAMMMAKRPPPNSIASRAATNVVSAAKIAGMTRSAKSETPNPCENAASSGTSEG